MKYSFFDMHGYMNIDVLGVICVLWDRVGTVRALADVLRACEQTDRNKS